MQISRFVEEDLRNRIVSGDELPEPMSLVQIAAHYKVSVTPVRRAVRELVASGHLRPPATRRGHFIPITAAPHGPRPTGEGLPPMIDWDQVLTKWVSDVALTGRGIFLREEATAAQFGIGRTIVRTIFGRLAGRGMLRHMVNRGWKVVVITLADASAYLEAREALELRALQLARHRLDPAILRKMLDGNPEGAPGDAAIDNNLHAYIIECADNRYISDFFERNGGCFSELFNQAGIESTVMDKMAHQHRQILSAMIAGDWEGAGRELSTHIRAQRPILEAALHKRQANQPQTAKVAQ